MESSTDPDARLYRKSARDPFRLGYLGHLAMEHRNGLIVASYDNLPEQPPYKLVLYLM